MPSYTNLRPQNPRDSLRKLLDVGKQHATVAHGVKVAQPGEGSVLIDGEGTPWRWDGETVRTYDERIAAGEEAVAAAAESLAAAEAQLEEARARIDATETDLTEKAEAVEEAKQTAEKAVRDLSRLEEELTGRVTAVESTLTETDRKATAAQEWAGEAVKAAQAAAEDLAEIQRQIEDAAQGGEATTEEVMRAAQAAKQAAERAAQTARDALAAANQAQGSAYGKVTVTYTEGAPPGVGLTVGDTHYRVDRAGTVLAWWRWDGKKWVAQSLDGAVVSSLDAGKITAGTLNAARIGAGSITVEKITVDGTLATRVVQAMDATAKRLVVTEETILAHTTLLGETVAEQLNVTGVLRGRDAILDGTLDVAQLNVTAEMSAEIVRAMDAEARRLVVTEDAILNRATVIESLVTPELIAERINVKSLGAELVTAGALQTDTAANRGIKIRSDGIHAWDSDGNKTITLDGRRNTIVSDEFATDTPGNPRTIIRKESFAGLPEAGRSASVIDIYGGEARFRDDHGVIMQNRGRLSLSARPWGSMAGGETGVNIARRRVDIGGEGTVTVAGTQGVTIGGGLSNSTTFQRGTVTIKGDMPANGWVTPSVTFPIRMAKNPIIILQPRSVQKAEFAWGFWGVTTTGFNFVLKNMTPRAGYTEVDWLAIAI